MNVLLINGSPHKKGCTYTALSEVAGQLEKNGIGSNIVHIGSKPIRGCIACGACRETGLCVFDDEAVVRNMTVDQEKVRALDGLLLHATAPGKDVDCVSRSFAPKCNVAEDPVCGSGHCHIVPYWVKALGKDSLVAYQASPRGGALYRTREGGRIRMSGRAALYAVSDIFVD